jgi:hypothetical protein
MLGCKPPDVLAGDGKLMVTRPAPVRAGLFDGPMQSAVHQHERSYSTLGVVCRKLAMSESDSADPFDPLDAFAGRKPRTSMACGTAWHRC